MLQSTPASYQVPAASDPVACPASSSGYQLRPTKLRLLRKGYEVKKTPLEPPTRVITNDASNGYAEWVNLANAPYHHPSGKQLGFSVFMKEMVLNARTLYPALWYSNKTEAHTFSGVFK